jgi:hypothetical protein
MSLSPERRTDTGMHASMNMMKSNWHPILRLSPIDAVAMRLPGATRVRHAFAMDTDSWLKSLNAGYGSFVMGISCNA